jgi:hypothetical protein
VKRAYTKPHASHPTSTAGTTTQAQCWNFVSQTECETAGCGWQESYGFGWCDLTGNFPLSGSAAPEHYFKFVAPYATGTYTFDSCGSGYDTYVVRIHTHARAHAHRHAHIVGNLLTLPCRCYTQPTRFSTLTCFYLSNTRCESAPGTSRCLWPATQLSRQSSAGLWRPATTVGLAAFVRDTI